MSGEVELISIPDNAEKLITYCARVSNPENQDAPPEKLISYLIAHKHWSPFEMVNAVLSIHTTRDIARQILRHRSFSFQEFSQRYAGVEDTFFTLREARLQHKYNRQLSVENFDENLEACWKRRQGHIFKVAKEYYDWAREHGIAREQARAVLPEGNTRTHMYVNGSIRSWMHYIEARTSPDTQKEHREIATSCAQVLREVIPYICIFVHENERKRVNGE